MNKFSNKKLTGLIEYISIFLLFFLLSIYITYPLIINLGKIIDPLDNIFSIWTLNWDVHVFTQNIIDVFNWNIYNANIFYPYKFSLGLSDSLISISPIYYIFYLITNNKISYFNILILFNLTLSGFSAFLFFKKLLNNTFFLYCFSNNIFILSIICILYSPFSIYYYLFFNVFFIIFNIFP